MNGCRTPNCERTPREGHAFCDSCFAYVWRHGKPPTLTAAPTWLRRFGPRDLRSAA